MREAILFTLDGTRYGVWRDKISSVEDVGSLHRLPFLKSSLNVLAVIGNRTRTLADLPACVGYPPTRNRSKAYALLMSEKEPVQGFLVTGAPVSYGVRPESVIAVPDYLSIPMVECCIDEPDQPVPVLDISALYERMRKGGREVEAHAHALRSPASPQAPEPTVFRAIGVAGNLMGLTKSEIEEKPLDNYRLMSFPLLPPDIDGIAVFHDRLLPTVDISRRISDQPPRGKSVLLEAKVGKASVGILVDEDRGEWAKEDSTVLELPLVSQLSWLRSAALRNGELASLVDLGAMLSSPREVDRTGNLVRHYTPDSKFPSLFGKGGIKVVEFSVLGRKHAVPESEVVDVVPYQTVRPTPLSPRIVAGVVNYQGSLLPVLDLARIHGQSSSPTAAWSMILVANGDFRAMVMSDNVSEARRLEPMTQRDVPVVLPYPVVYGCYTDGDSVRLIFNIEALAAHFEESRVAEMMPALAPAAAFERTETRAPAPSVQGMDVAVPQNEPLEQPSVPVEPEVEAPDNVQDARPEPPPIPEIQTQGVAPEPAEPSPAPSIELSEEKLSYAAAEETPAVEADMETVIQADAETTEVGRRPDHSPARRLLGFVISMVVLLGLGAGLYYGEPLLKPRTNAAVPAAAPVVAAPVVAAPAPAAQQAAVVPVNPQPIAQSSSPTVLYTVKEGDTLWDISNRFTGNPFNYHAIAGQNRIPNPDLIFPGQRLETPSGSSGTK